MVASIAEHGVQVPVVVDEEGIIDGYTRVRACETLAWIVDASTRIPDWRQVADAAGDDRKSAVEVYGRKQVEDAETLASYGADLVELACECRWADPPVVRHERLTSEQRRRLSVRLNAHRRQLSRGQLRQVVEAELMADPARTDRAIGELVGASQQWVNDIRRQMEEDERILANPEAVVEVTGSGIPFRPVGELDCPHCSHHLRLLRGGREFALELDA